MERERPVSTAFLYTSSRVPSKAAPPSRFPSQSSHKDAPPLEPLHPFLKGKAFEPGVCAVILHQGIMPKEHMTSQ